MIEILKLFFFICLIIRINGRDYWSTDQTEEFTYKNYMKNIPNRILDYHIGLNDIIILATHDSATFTIDGASDDPYLNSAVCQTRNIKRQLWSGVRFFDLRVGLFEHFWHGPYMTETSFDELIKVFKEFLNEFPDEIIFYTVSHDSNYLTGCPCDGKEKLCINHIFNWECVNGKEVEGNFIKKMKKEIDHLTIDSTDDWNWKKIDCRGKVILVEDSTYQTLGKCPENSEIDHWDSDIEDKKQCLENLMNNHTGDKKLFVSLPIAFGVNFPEVRRFPIGYAKDMNDWYFKKITENYFRYKPIISVDFVSENMILKLIEQKSRYFSEQYTCDCCTMDFIMPDTLWKYDAKYSGDSRFKVSSNNEIICDVKTAWMQIGDYKPKLSSDSNYIYLKKNTERIIILDNPSICYKLNDSLDLLIDVNNKSLSNHSMWLDQSIRTNSTSIRKWSLNNVEGKICMTDNYYVIENVAMIDGEELHCQFSGHLSRGGTWRKEMWSNNKQEEDLASIHWIRLDNRQSLCEHNNNKINIEFKEKGRFGMYANGKNDKLGIRIEFSITTLDDKFMTTNEGKYCYLEMDANQDNDLFRI